MTRYTRLYVPGGTYFFTVRLADLRADTLTRHIGLLRDSIRLTRQRMPFEINAAVILPSEAHMIWTMPCNDADFSKRWRMIKSTFSRHLPAPDNICPSKQRRREKGVWQRRFWEHLIRDHVDYETHLRLIQTAPVAKGLVRHSADWPYSSFTRKAAREPA